MNSRQGAEAWAKIAQQLNRARVQASGGGGGGGRGSGGGGPAKGFMAGGGAIVALAAGGIALNSALFNVDGGHRAIKYSRIHGIRSDIYPEGTHLVIPWLETAVLYDVRAKPRNIASLTGTKDLQMVNITCRVLSKPSVNDLPT
ncbi:prohibitin-2, partial [Cryptococcus floricola]